MKYLFSILFLAVTASYQAQVCKSYLQDSMMLIGERNIYQLTVEAYPSKITLPEKIKLWGVRSSKKTNKRDTVELEISAIKADSVVKNGVQHVLLSFTAWDTGYIQPFPLVIDSTKHIVFPLQALQVAYPKVNAQGDILDIEAGKIDVDPNSKGNKAVSWWMYGLIGLLIAVGIFLFFFLRKKKHISPAPEIILPLDERTKQRLNELYAHKWWEKDQLKRHFVELTEIIRSYTGENFGIDAMEKTTNQLNYALKSKNVHEGHIQLLIQLLKESDLVKFAKHRLASEDIIAINDKALLFVELSYLPIETTEA